MTEIKNETTYRFEIFNDSKSVNPPNYAHVIDINGVTVGSLQRITLDGKNNKIILDLIAVKDGNNLPKDKEVIFNITTYPEQDCTKSFVLLKAQVSCLEKNFKIDIHEEKPEYRCVYKVEKILEDPCKFFE